MWDLRRKDPKCFQSILCCSFGNSMVPPLWDIWEEQTQDWVDSLGETKQETMHNRLLKPGHLWLWILWMSCILGELTRSFMNFRYLFHNFIKSSPVLFKRRHNSVFCSFLLHLSTRLYLYTQMNLDKTMFLYSQYFFFLNDNLATT